MSRPELRTAAGAVATVAALAAMLCACSGGAAGTRLLERFGSIQAWGNQGRYEP
jgi:hypothetical protein